MSTDDMNQGTAGPEGVLSGRPRRKSSMKKTAHLEWTGWTRGSSQRALVSPQAIPRASIKSNVPQFWEEAQADSENTDDPRPTGGGALVKKSNDLDPMALLLKAISNIWGFLTGFFHRK